MHSEKKKAEEKSESFLKLVLKNPSQGTAVVHSAWLCRGRAPNRALFSPNSLRTITLPGICVRWHIASVLSLFS